ncbi:MAG: zf-HC2 domain-containing protein [Ktedonobacteraceae bacterium]|nr:zf-HC2 domain-containing protein [Ktedonobacteraceae bacterium]
MAQQHEHLTIEQLSAFLDKQLAPQEQAACEAHMRSCTQCQQSLAQIRQTVALLHALPQAELPRSFVLPADSVPAPMRTHSQQASNIIPMARRQHPAWTHIARSSLRAVSTIAAVVAIVFMMSSLLAVLPTHSNNASTAAPSAFNGTGAGRTPPTAQSARSQPHATAATHTASTNNDATKTPTSSPSPTPQTQQNQHEVGGEAPPGPPSFDLSMPGSRLLVGAILLLLSILGIFFTRRRQPRPA